MSTIEDNWKCERCCDMHVLYYVDKIENCPECIGPSEVITPTGGGTFPVYPNHEAKQDGIL